MVVVVVPVVVWDRVVSTVMAVVVVVDVAVLVPVTFCSWGGDAEPGAEGGGLRRGGGG